MTDTALAALWFTLAGLLLLAALLLLCTWLLHRAARRLELQRSPAPQPQWYYQRPGETPRGPVDLTALRAMRADGRLDAAALAARVGSAEWRPLSELP